MVVAIGGAHGKIGMRLTRLLSSEGDRVIGLIRNPDHSTTSATRRRARRLRPGAGHA